jgi:hypothetical protein
MELVDPEKRDNPDININININNKNQHQHHAERLGLPKSACKKRLLILDTPEQSFSDPAISSDSDSA